MTNPYQGFGPQAFWRSAVAEAGAFGLSDLWQPKFAIRPSQRIVTFGSCFAQHIGRALAARGYGWFEAEVPPPFLTPEAAARFGYGVFSARTGNIYTARMLQQWLALAQGAALPDEVWADATGSRVIDPLRPAVEPDGFNGVAEALAARAATAAAFGAAVKGADIMVFTLGLTESWSNRASGLEYALCPGTAGGTFDAAQHVFGNATVAQVLDRMTTAVTTLRTLNPRLRVLLTVSPVPLTATASGRHVLVATTQSKSVLRAVAGELAASHDFVDYFPSYEIITAPVMRGMFFAPNLRSVEPQGVAEVMRHFFAGQEAAFGPVPVPQAAPGAETPQPRSPVAAARQSTIRRRKGDVICEEELLDAFGR